MRFGQTKGSSYRQQALVPDRALTFPLPGKQAIPEKTCVELAPKKKAVLLATKPVRVAATTEPIP
jgi:hypothetical protein